MLCSWVQAWRAHAVERAGGARPRGRSRPGPPLPATASERNAVPGRPQTRPGCQWRAPFAARNRCPPPVWSPGQPAAPTRRRHESGCVAAESRGAGVSCLHHFVVQCQPPPMRSGCAAAKSPCSGPCRKNGSSVAIISGVAAVCFRRRTRSRPSAASLPEVTKLVAPFSVRHVRGGASGSAGHAGSRANRGRSFSTWSASVMFSSSGSAESGARTSAGTVKPSSPG